MSGADANTKAIIGALSETGAIGSTVRQLSGRLSTPERAVSSSLARLQRDGQVLRIGRGLWLLREFESLETRGDFPGPSQFEERFRRENGLTLGRAPGPITFASNQAEPFHRWWPYVQGFSAEFVRSVLTKYEPDGWTVFDPFAGSGTTLIEARLMGRKAVGAEILPPAALAARVKTNFELSLPDLRRCKELWFRRATQRRPSVPFLRETSRQFERGILDTLGQLRAALPPEGTPVNDAIRLLFDRILIPSSHLHRSPCLGYRREQVESPEPPRRQVDFALDEMSEDLAAAKALESTWGPPAQVYRVDARQTPGRSESVDLAITSPPYVNGMDYATNYKLDLAWLGYVNSYSELVALRRSMVACDNLPRSDAARFLEIRRGNDPWLVEILRRIRANVRRKGTYRRDDVHGIVLRYFLDLEEVLRRVHQLLRAGGRFILVVGDSLIAGTYVPGDLLLARLGESVGFAIESVDVARSRRSGQRRSFRLRESVVTLVKPGDRGA